MAKMPMKPPKGMPPKGMHKMPGGRMMPDKEMQPIMGEKRPKKAGRKPRKGNKGKNR